MVENKVVPVLARVIVCSKICMNEQELKEKITNLFLSKYLPKLKRELRRFLDEAIDNEILALTISSIIKVPVSSELGTLRLAEPTNEMIDDLMKIYGENNREDEEESGGKNVLILLSNDN